LVFWAYVHDTLPFVFKGREKHLFNFNKYSINKVMRNFTFTGTDYRSRFCGCQNCGSEDPVYRPHTGETLYSTGYSQTAGHKSTATLFISADRERGTWVSGRHAPYLPLFAGVRTRRVFKKSGHTHLGMVPSGGDIDFLDAGEYVTDIKEVAEVLMYAFTPEQAEARMKEFSFPKEYIGEIVSEMRTLPVPTKEECEDAFFGSNYHCYGDVFMLGGEGDGEFPSFKFGWSYGNPSEDKRSAHEKEWDEIVPAIDSGNAPEPIFYDLDIIPMEGSYGFQVIKWNGREWRRKYELCPGKYNWVDTGTKWCSVGEWEEIVIETA
jgi:hypothetical protein